MFLTVSEMKTRSPLALLRVTTSGDHDNFILEASEPATAPTLREPPEPDFARLGVLAHKHGQEILDAFPQ